MSYIVSAGARTADDGTPLLREPITSARAKVVSRRLKALADPVRLKMMSIILSHEGGEACAMCDLTEGFALSQPTISHHLKVLHEAGLVDREKRGVWVFYRTRPEALDSLRTFFNEDLAQAEPPGSLGGQ